MVGIYVTSITLLSIWNRNDVSLSMNVATGLMMLSLIYCGVSIFEYSSARNLIKLIFDILFIGIPFILSAVVVGRLYAIRDKSPMQQNDEMQNSNLVHIYKSTAGIQITYISLLFISAYCYFKSESAK